MGRAPAFVRLLGQGLSLAVLRRPRSTLDFAGFGTFFAAWLLGVVMYVAIDFARTPAPREFDGSGLLAHGGVGLALLLAAWLAARLLRRPAILFELAALAAIALLPWLTLSETALDLGMQWKPRVWIIGFAWAALLAVSARLVWVLGADASRVRRLLAWLGFALVMVPMAHERAQAYVWYEAFDPSTLEPEVRAQWEAAQAGSDVPSLPRVNTARTRAAARAQDPETLFGRQPALVTAALDKLAPQRPGHVDLYALGFAGDGTEPPFRNEVVYLERLLAQRFDAAGRVLTLDNHPAAPASTPLATLANLRAGLAGIGARMDRNEDVLFLYLTTHGSEEHWLLVQRPPLPMRQVRPGDLRDALDDAGIRWRVIVVSACYSGGFIDALKDPQTLVITAARADRPSFGCGAKSTITWFGDEFLIGALNRTHDFREAYAIASREVRAREREEDEEPSSPQLWVGERIEAKLLAWKRGLPPAPPVPFVATVSVDDDEEQAHHRGASR